MPAGSRQGELGDAEKHAAVVLQRFLDAYSAFDLDGMAATLDPDVVWELPGVTAPVPERIVGRDALMAMIRAVPQHLTSETARDVSLHVSPDDPEELFGTWTTDVVERSGNQSEVDYVAHARVRDGRIVHYREHTTVRRSER